MTKKHWVTAAFWLLVFFVAGVVRLVVAKDAPFRDAASTGVVAVLILLGLALVSVLYTRWRQRP